MLEEFLEPGGTPRGLVLTGGPGVGKTALWEAGIEAARRPRAARPARERQRRRDAALLRGADRPPGRNRPRASSTALPPPQRQALEVALYRADAAGAARRVRARARPAEHAALARGRTSRSWSRSTTSSGSTRPPWMRSPSPPAGWKRSPSRSCSPGAPGRHPRSSGRSARAWRAPRLGRSASARCAGCSPSGSGLTLPRHVLRRVYETTLGNPLFSLEVGPDDRRQRCAGADRGRPAAGGRRGPARNARRPARRAGAQADAGARARLRPARVAARRDRRPGRARGRARRGSGRRRRRPPAARASAPGRRRQVRLASA